MRHCTILQFFHSFQLTKHSIKMKFNTNEITTLFMSSHFHFDHSLYVGNIVTLYEVECNSEKLRCFIARWQHNIAELRKYESPLHATCNCIFRLYVYLHILYIHTVTYKYQIFGSTIFKL